MSGSAPLGFAPTQRNGTRFTDGAVSAPVPARALVDYGADLIFACNAVAGPAGGDPIGQSAIGRFLYNYTLLGRLFDLWMSLAFLLQRTSREVSEDASVFFQPPLEEVPFLECFQFGSAAKIAEKSEQSPELQEAVKRCDARWREFAGFDGGSA
jgi:predicted acylesterase/phospholipase RssA